MSQLCRSTELMDALSDPRAFMSAQEKRENQMKAMGIEAADLNAADVKVIQKGEKKTQQQEDKRRECP